jgi:hypothetical protein
MVVSVGSGSITLGIGVSVGIGVGVSVSIGKDVAVAVGGAVVGSWTRGATPPMELERTMRGQTHSARSPVADPFASNEYD